MRPSVAATHVLLVSYQEGNRPTDLFVDLSKSIQRVRMSDTSAVVQRLHRIWRQKTDIESQLASGPRQIAVIESRLKAATAAVAKHREAIKQQKMEADRRQLQMREREAKVFDLGVKMNMSKNNREYQTLKEQIAADKEANNVLADEILENLETIDELNTQTQSLLDNESAAKEDLKNIEAKIVVAAERLKIDLQAVMAELVEAEKALVGDLRSVYKQLIPLMGEDAMAGMEETSCGGCYTTMTPKMIDTLEMGHAIKCTSCGRLVYMAQ